MPVTKKKQPAKQNKVVNRKFLENLAKRIYDPKTRKYLRLCTGALQDKICGVPMHCGLGELYFEMTGKQPLETGIDEDNVIAMAINRSTLNVDSWKMLEQARSAIKNLKMSKAVKDVLDDHLLDVSESDLYDAEVEAFKEVLEEVMSKNDGADPKDKGKFCPAERYRRRAMRVARCFRDAAKLLPK